MGNPEMLDCNESGIGLVGSGGHAVILEASLQWLLWGWLLTTLMIPINVLAIILLPKSTPG
jgi:hypothetical protein